MLLITTPSKKYIDFSKKILFLGKWCLINLSKNELDKIDYKILDYHWKDLEKVERDSLYILSTYKTVVRSLADHLNIINGKNHSYRYWEILIGPWLFKFIDFLFEKYSLINSANDQYQKLETENTDKFFIPYSFADFSSLSGEDEFIFSIFNQIIENCNLSIDIFSKENIKKKLIIHNSHSKKFSKFSIKQFIRKYLLNFPNFLINIFKKKIAQNNNFFMDINLPIKKNEKKELFMKINNIYYDEYKNISSDLHKNEKIFLNNNLRNANLKIINKKDDKFINLLSKVILKNIPIEYLENYNFLSNNIKSSLPKKIPTLVGVRCALEYNIVTRLLTAHLSECGSKIISCQEGGGMGVRKFNQIDEDVNFIGCDKFLTWGWNSKHKNSHKFYLTKTFFVNKYNYNKSGKILFTGGSCRKYHYSLFAGHLPFYNETHIIFNKNLIRKLNNTAFQNMTYRFHNQSGYLEVDRILSEFPNLNISLREKETHYYNLLYDSNLIICTSDYTANLLPLFINHPVIWYWDPKYFNLRAEAKKFYDLMFEAGILYYSADSCSEHINKIHLDPMEWWMTDKVQSARKIFIENFCNPSKNISTDLSILIKQFNNEYKI